MKLVAEERALKKLSVTVRGALGRGALKGLKAVHTDKGKDPLPNGKTLTVEIVRVRWSLGRRSSTAIRWIESTVDDITMETKVLSTGMVRGGSPVGLSSPTFKFARLCMIESRARPQVHRLLHFNYLLAGWLGPIDSI